MPKAEGFPLAPGVVPVKCSKLIRMYSQLKLIRDESVLASYAPDNLLMLWYTLLRSMINSLRKEKKLIIHFCADIVVLVVLIVDIVV